MLIVNENIASLFGTVGNVVCYMTTGVLFLDRVQSEVRNAAMCVC